MADNKVARVAERMKEYKGYVHKKWHKGLSFTRPATRSAITRSSSRAARFESYSHSDWTRKPKVSARVASVIKKQKKKGSFVKSLVRAASSGFKKGLKPKEPKK